ncbi:MAG: type II secretion system protein [Candidatus Margulisbacteria bacterium]|nr:type II secretion system protein [Candidatus Margulisiibacteriota bacterium]
MLAGEGKKGFSLVELILSLSIFAFLLVAILYALSGEIKFWKRATDICRQGQIADFAISKIVDDIHSASQILPQSSASVLALSVEANSIEYSLYNQKVRRKTNNSTAYLTDSGEITNLSFNYPRDKLVVVMAENISTEADLRN